MDVRDRPGLAPPVDTSVGASFAVLLAVALVLDQVWWGGFEVVSPHGLVVLAAVAVLLAPASTGRLAVLLAATAGSVAVDLPAVGSHRQVELVVAVAVLVQLGVMAVRDRRPPSVGALGTAIAPLLRATVVVVYLASALAKLNTAFLDPATSCGTAMVQQVLGPDPALLGASLLEPALIGTVAVEALLPLLLVLRRTRVAGIVAGTGFHVVLALAGNVPFSAVMLALYAGFLPADTGRRVRAALGDPRVRLPHGARPLAAAVLVAGWLVAAGRGPSSDAPGLTGPPSALVAPALGVAATAAYLALAVVAVGLVLVSRLAAPGPPGPPGPPGRPGPEPSRRTAPVLVLATAVLVVQALCPYLGWKTDTSFEMFSGLRTEPGAWNHLLVPEVVRVATPRFVEVVAASDPGLVARTGDGSRTALLELDRALRSAPGTVAVHRSAADPVPRLLGPLPEGQTVLQRLVLLRDTPPPGVPRC